MVKDKRITGSETSHSRRLSTKNQFVVVAALSAGAKRFNKNNLQPPTPNWFIIIDILLTERSQLSPASHLYQDLWVFCRVFEPGFPYRAAGQANIPYGTYWPERVESAFCRPHLHPSNCASSLSRYWSSKGTSSRSLSYLSSEAIGVKDLKRRPSAIFLLVSIGSFQTPGKQPRQNEL